MTNCLSKREIYQFEMEDKKYLLDVATSRVFTIDDLTSKVLELTDSYSRTEIINILAPKFDAAEVNAVLNELQQIGRTGTDGECPPLPSALGITTLDLQVSRECNLRCKYCYAKWGELGGKKGFMKKDVAKKAVDFLMRESGESKKCRINFDGGEPLLNFEVIKYVVARAMEQSQKLGKEITFGLITNGTLLSDKIIKFLNKNKFSINVSLDGPKEIHDRLRVFKDGKGSYDSIIPGLKKLIEAKNREVTCSLVVTKHSLGCLKEVVGYLYKLGFSKVTLAFVRGNGNGEEWAFREKDLAKVKEEYKKLASFCLGKFFERGEFGLTNFYTRLKSLHFRTHRILACGAGRNYVAISPNGTIYPCHAFVGMSEFSIGNLIDGLERRRQKKFIENGIDTKPDCKNCWARYFCGGGCAYDATLVNGDMFRPDPFRCSITKEEVKLGIMLYSEVYRKGGEFLNKLFEQGQNLGWRRKAEERSFLEVQSLC